MKVRNPNNFRLEKLYLDCLDDKGNCFIIYRAELQLFFLKLNYSGLIFSDSSGTLLQKSSVRKTAKPLSDELMVFYDNTLNITGHWLRIDDPLPSFCLTDRNEQELVWNCHHPKALTEISFKGSSFRGFGYAETLALSIKPWKLPLEELRWGRFLSDEYAVTWINWRGKHPVNKLYCNGTEYNDAIIEDSKIFFGENSYVLLFNEISVIRRGRLSNLFTMIPWMKIFFDKRFLNTIENKYKAKSTLLFEQELTASGWSLFESVIWKK